MKITYYLLDGLDLSLNIDQDSGEVNVVLNTPVGELDKQLAYVVIEVIRLSIIPLNRLKCFFFCMNNKRRNKELILIGHLRWC